MDPFGAMGDLPPNIQSMLGQMLGQMIGRMPGMDYGGGGSDDEDDEDAPGVPSWRGARPGPDDAERARQLAEQLAVLRDPAAGAVARVAALHRLLALLRSARTPPAAFISAGGAATLCDIITRDWPHDGDLAASFADADLVVAIRPSAAGRSGSAAAAASAPLSRLPHHSPRRVAAGCVAELCRWAAAVDAMWRDGFFRRLPPIMLALAARYRYGQSHGRMYGRGVCTDQGQYMLERLTAACVDAARVRDSVRTLVAEQLLERMYKHVPWLNLRRANKVARLRLQPRPEDDHYTPGAGGAPSGTHYPGSSSSSEAEGGASHWEEWEAWGGEDEAEQDPEQQQGRGTGGRAAAGGGGEGSRRRTRRRRRRAVNRAPGAVVPELELSDMPPAPGEEFLRGLFNDGGPEEGPSDPDPFPTAFMRLVAGVWFGLPAPTQQRLVDGGMLAALMAFPTDRNYTFSAEGPLLHDMRRMYQGMALGGFGPLRSANAGLREAASALRLRGNEAFKAGRLEAALAAYTRAVALDWDEPVHRNNRCFTLLKLGRLAEARGEGVNSVGCDPRSARSWSRLAAVFEALRQPQCAQLCYRQALALLAPRGDEELEGRLQEAERQLRGSRAWQFKNLPRRDIIQGMDRWMAWMGRHLPAAQARALEEYDDLPRAMARLAGGGGRGQPGERGPVDSAAHAAATGSEAYQATVHLLPLWEAACAMEEAPNARLDHTLRVNLSWSDTTLRDRTTGLVFYTLSCMAGNSPRLMMTPVPGKPRFPTLRNGLCMAIARPCTGSGPARPASVFLAHRAVPYYSELSAYFGRMGIEILCETPQEAAQSAANYNTDPWGCNHRDQYADEAESPGGTGPSATNSFSDDDMSATYRLMLADAAAAGSGAGRGAAECAGLLSSGPAGASGSGGGGKRGTPSDQELRTATEALLQVFDTSRVNIKSLMAALQERFGVDLSSKRQMVHKFAVSCAGDAKPRTGTAGSSGRGASASRNA